MPILWRYVLKQYAKVFALCVVTFIALLFVSRAKQIAEFASMGAGASHIGMFAMFLIPYVLPYAIPISCLISSVLLCGQLSKNQELTAMRACGLSLRRILGPMLLAGALLGVFNFYVASELATHSHMLGRRMEAQVAGLNPLSLLQNSRLLRMGDVFVEMRTVKSGELAKDMTLVLFNPGSQRLHVVTADRLKVEDETLMGTGINLLGSLPADSGGFDHLIIENQQEMWTSAESLGQLLGRRRLHLKPSHLRMRMLLASASEQSGEDWARHMSEVFRRISIALAAVTFTVMGCAFGIQTGRRTKKRGIAAALGLGTLCISCYAVAGGIETHFPLSAIISIVPQLVVLALCGAVLKRVTKGATA